MVAAVTVTVLAIEAVAGAPAATATATVAVLGPAAETAVASLHEIGHRGSARGAKSSVDHSRTALSTLGAHGVEPRITSLGTASPSV